MSYEELEHTADIRLRFRTPDLESLFSEAVEALMTIMYHDPRPGPVRREVRLEAADTEDMLVDFLSEVLFLSEVESEVYSNARVDISGSSLRATLTGELFDPERHRAGTEVKGISRSGFQIVKEDEGYLLDIIFDV